MNRTHELIARAQTGDMSAKETLVQENSGLIWSVAKRFIGRGTESDDLYQLGCLGFLKAIEGFDSAYGTQFSTYAVPKISGEIRRFLRDDGAVKVSRTIKEQAIVIKNAQNTLLQQLGRDATVMEIAEYTGLTAEQIATAEYATAVVESIYQDAGAEGFTLESILTDTASDEAMIDRISLRQAVDRLADRESLVIRLRYYHGLTQEKIAKILTVSQVQVSRIEKRALHRLREYLL